MKIFRIPLLFIFVFYWIATIIFNMPDNPVRSILAKPLYDFNLLFSQKWNFFAPPPKSNSKLYFVYYSNEKPLYSCEVLSTILQEKRAKAPFNSKEEAVDYIISGSISQLTNYIILNRENLSFQNQTKKIEDLDSDARKILLAKTNDINEFKTLVNFSKIVAKKKIPEETVTKINKIKIIITETEIPKFHDRYNKEPEEKLLLETNYMNYE